MTYLCNPRRLQAWQLTCLLLIAPISLILFGSALAQASPPTPADLADRISEELRAGQGQPTDLTQLAAKGQFEQVLVSLRNLGPVANDPRVATLIHDLEALREHQATHLEQRRQARDKALAAMGKQMAKGSVEEALVSAIEAHGLAEDRAAMLRQPEVLQLVQRTEQAARDAAKQGDWIETLSLYRLLDYLHEDPGTYRDVLRDADRHARILRLYAPDEFKRLFDQRVERLNKLRKEREQERAAEGDVAEKEKEKNKRNLEPLQLDDETWQQRLAGIEQTMFRRALSETARKHVSGPGYAPLLRGAMDSLLVLADTKGLEKTFPNFGDAAKRKRFRDEVAGLRRELDQAKGLTALDVAECIDRVSKLNGQTLGLPMSVLVYEMADGAMSQLDDFTSVIWPSERDQFLRNTQGEFYGVGIQIALKLDPRAGRERLSVVSPVEGSPAHQAGIKPGDFIATVNGRSTANWSLDRAVREITGPEGTPVTLGIERDKQPQPLSFDLKRAKIPIDTIRGWSRNPGGSWEYYIDPQEKIGYVRLSQFVPQTARDLDAAINQMEDAGGVRALILDLRFDPGGLLSSAVEVSNRFISDGVIVSTADASGQSSEEYVAKKQRAYKPFPVVVLVNRGSASASEIVAGALQDHQRALIVGNRSFGKGSVQNLVPLDGDVAFLKLTTQYYKLPNGRIIHRTPDAKTWGIEPDLNVYMTDEQVADSLEFRQKIDVLREIDEIPDAAHPAPVAGEILSKGMDPQLETAVAVLKTRLVSQQVIVAQQAAPVGAR